MTAAGNYSREGGRNICIFEMEVKLMAIKKNRKKRVLKYTFAIKY